MIPVPRFPLYTALIAEFDFYPIGYYLNENNFWELKIEELQRAYNEAKEHSYPRVMVVINPGNPTGQVLTRENVVEIIKFAYKNRLFIFADEVK